MKLPDDHTVCAYPGCRKIVHVSKIKRFVSWIEWGSLSGTPHYEFCCKTHKTDKDGYIPGKAYA
jgi:hypothetical protein